MRGGDGGLDGRQVDDSHALREGNGASHILILCAGQVKSRAAGLSRKPLASNPVALDPPTPCTGRGVAESYGPGMGPGLQQRIRYGDTACKRHRKPPITCEAGAS